MELTNQQILDAISKRVDYAEIARLLELDLNAIATQVITESEDYIQFKVFFDIGEFNTTITAQAPGEGQGFFETPVLISLVNGSYTNARGPQLYSLEFRIESFGFEKDYENIRKVLEAYSSINQGAIRSGEFNDALVTSTCDFPVLTTPSPYKGFNRFSAFMSWFLTFVYTGQLSNEVIIKLDGTAIEPTSFNANRQRVSDAAHKVNTSETVSINKSQVLSFAMTFPYNNSDLHKRILRNLKNNDIAKLNEVYVLSIEMPEVGDTNTYNVILTDGSFSLAQGGYLLINATFSISGV